MSAVLKNHGAGIYDELERLAKAMTTVAEFGLQDALKKGADEVQISANASFRKRLVVENKEFSLANSLQTQNISIVLHKEHKKGSASVNSAEATSLAKAAEDALALASFSKADTSLAFAKATAAPRNTQLKFLYDGDLAEMDLAELQEGMTEVLAELSKDKRVALDRFEMGINVSYHTLLNSHGVHQVETQTMVNWDFLGMAVDGGEVSGMDYDGGFAFAKKGYLTAAVQEAAAFVKKVVKNLNPTRCNSYKGAIILSPRAVEEILIPTVLYHSSGRSVMDGKSRWQNALGTKVAAPLLTIVDDPHNARFSGATSFDGDGIPTRQNLIFDKGVLRMHLHDCYSARRLKVESTATSGGPFGLQVSGGHNTLQDLAGQQKELLYVDRFSGNCDPVTGSFSGVAKSIDRFRIGFLDDFCQYCACFSFGFAGDDEGVDADFHAVIVGCCFGADIVDLCPDTFDRAALGEIPVRHTRGHIARGA